MRRAIAAFCVAAAIAFPARAQSPPAAAADTFPGAAAAYLVIADGEPLWASAADRRLPPASLTKLMTALLVVETTPLEAVVRVSPRASRTGGARMGLAAGTRIRVSELLAGLLLRSGNDACVALAERVDGSEARFVERMNARALSLGLADTRFANACGFDAPGHYSSARDLARLAQQLLATPSLARWVALAKYTAHAVDGRAFAMTNTNVLMGLVPGLAGVKTGSTEGAGHCLIGYAEREGRSVLVVLLGARDRWWDAVAMIEQAFARAPASFPSAPRRTKPGT